MGVIDSSFRVLAKAKSLVVAEPMIPLVYKRLVELLEKRETSMISTSYIHLGHGVSAGCDAHRHTPDGEILGGQLDEVQGD